MLGEGIFKSSHFEADDGNVFTGPGVGSQASKTALKVQDKGTPIGKSASVGDQLKCLYTNVQSRSNCRCVRVCLQGCDVTGITETWWDGSHN